MNSLVYLYLAYGAAVLVIGGYIAYLVRQVAGVRSELERLKQEERD